MLRHLGHRQAPQQPEAPTAIEFDHECLQACAESRQDEVVALHLEQGDASLSDGSDRSDQLGDLGRRQLFEVSIAVGAAGNWWSPHAAGESTEVRRVPIVTVSAITSSFIERVSSLLRAGNAAESEQILAYLTAGPGDGAGFFEFELGNCCHPGVGVHAEFHCIRARLDPAQRWMPTPNTRWRF